MNIFNWCLLYKIHKRRISRKHSLSSPQKNSRYRKAFLGTLSAEDRRLRQRRLNRPSLLPVSKSPWRKALASRDDQALITTTGFNYESLKYIFASFAPIFDDYSPFLDEKIVKKHSTKGRKRKIHVEDCVGLVLMWTRTRGSMYSFAFSPSFFCYGKRYFFGDDGADTDV